MICECDLSPALESQLAQLLDVCFPDTFAGRCYFKQLPHFRFLAFAEEQLVGQVGVDFRVIQVGHEHYRIFGVIDLCVAPAHQRQGIAAGLLAAVEARARTARADFVVLMADHHELYLANGYQRVEPAPTRWLAIEERSSVQVIERDLADIFLVKCISRDSWPPGPVDLLGYLF